MARLKLSAKQVRSRTGCLTCRKRRVKCDEIKPVCKRCIAADVICDGYPKQKNVPSRTEPTPITGTSQERLPVELAFQVSPSPAPSLLAISQPENDRVSLGFYHHFITSTIPRLFEGDHCEFWLHHVTSKAWHDRLVLDAILAVGAAHQSCLMSSSRTHSSDIIRLKVSGLHSYSKSVQSISKRMTESEEDDSESIIIVVILLSYFEASYS